LGSELSDWSKARRCLIIATTARRRGHGRLRYKYSKMIGRNRNIKGLATLVSIVHVESSVTLAKAMNLIGRIRD